MSTYNGERYVAEQVASIRAQDHPSVRLVVRDDGSTDGTVAVLTGLKVAVDRGENLGVPGRILPADRRLLGRRRPLRAGRPGRRLGAREAVSGCRGAERCRRARALLRTGDGHRRAAAAALRPRAASPRSVVRQRTGPEHRARLHGRAQPRSARPRPRSVAGRVRHARRLALPRDRRLRHRRLRRAGRRAVPPARRQHGRAWGAVRSHGWPVGSGVSSRRTDRASTAARTASCGGSSPRTSRQSTRRSCSPSWTRRGRRPRARVTHSPDRCTGRRGGAISS